MALGSAAAVGLVSPALAAPAPPPPSDPFSTCPNLGYQMQSVAALDSDFGYFDLNTAKLVNPAKIDSPVNAFGYSRTQKVFWGMYTNLSNDELVRIDSLGNVSDSAPLDGPLAPPIVTTNTGTIGIYNGKEALFLQTKVPANELIVVDIDPADDAMVGTVLARFPLSRTTPGLPYLRIGDWDFNSSDGLLYTLEMVGDTTRRLVSVNPTTGVVTDVKDLSDRLPDGQNYGAVYVEDVSGTIYFSNNDVNDRFAQGQPGGFSQTFSYYPALDVVIAYTPGSAARALLINDGADCLVATDFGDAPDTYQTLNPNGGPGHIFSEVGDPDKLDDDGPQQLRIGTLIDSDLDGIPTDEANGDDINLPVNDEDGIPGGTVLDRNGATLTVPITNTTGAAAILAGWVDFDGSGTFEAGERALIPVPAAGGSAILSWPTAAGTVTSTYLRLRLYPAGDPTAADPQPVGAEFVNGGEIEDHRIGLVTGSLAVTGADVGSLVKAGTLLVVFGGLGLALGGRGNSGRRPSPRPRRVDHC